MTEELEQRLQATPSGRQAMKVDAAARTGVTRKHRIALGGLGFVAGLFSLAGCQSYHWPDAWQPIEVPKGVAWHNKAWQQTAFDADGDGRVDRLRFWIGSGLAEEFLDDDRDGWFDRFVSSVYGKDAEPKPIHQKAPAVPVTGEQGAFNRPQIY